LLFGAVQTQGQGGDTRIRAAAAGGRPEGGGQGQADRSGGRRQDEVQGVHQAFSLGAARAFRESLGEQ
jgi:hypothetical protein